MGISSYFCRDKSFSDKTDNDMTNAKLIGLSSVQHFLVDGLCICSMFLLAEIYGERFGAYGDRVSMGAVLVYNVLAFVSQPLTGMMADRMTARHWLLIASSLLLTLAVACASMIPTLMAEAPNLMWDGLGEGLLILVAVLLGAGNSLFHVWGGKQTVVKTGNDIRALGVFVSTGVLGLAVGLICRSWALLYGLLLAYVAVGIVYVHSEFVSARAGESEDTRIERGRIRPPLTPPTQEGKLPQESSCAHASAYLRLFAVMALMLFVCCRSFVGEVFSGGMTKTQELILLIAVGSMLGKMAGGWIARWMGIWRSLAVILAGVVVCIFFNSYFEPMLLVGIFLMNCTMPITLYLANVLLPRREGLAFGLLAAALIPGYLLAVYW